MARSDRDRLLVYWLGKVAQEARETGGKGQISPELLAPFIGVNNTTLRRFEQGQTLPNNLDEILAAYAYLAGTDPRDLVARAVKQWMADGRAYKVPPKLPGFLKLLDLNNSKDVA